MRKALGGIGMSRGSKAMIVFERLQREQAEADARRQANSGELSRPSTRKALTRDRNGPIVAG